MLAVRRFPLVHLFAIFALAITIGAPANASSSADAVRLIVHVDADGPPAHVELLRGGAVSVQAAEYLPATLIVHAPAARIGAIARTGGVAFVERDVLMSIEHHCPRPGHPHCPPDDPDPEPTPDPDPEPDPDPTGEIPWGVDKIQAPAAWEVSTGSGSTVCVADTGIDASHPDLTVSLGRNFSGGNANNWSDRHGHGTHVAGTVAANGGILGVAPHATLIAAKVLGNSGSGWTSDIAAGIRWCADVGADVINMSFGSSSGTTTLHDAMKYADDRGSLLVSSSGNSGASQPGFPARYPEVIAVGATDVNDVIASWSNRGEEINAPGVAVTSTVPGGGYETWSGTSMASPHVAGVAALVVANNTSATTQEVRTTLTNTADGIGSGAIRVNAASAVAD